MDQDRVWYTTPGNRKEYNGVNHAVLGNWSNQIRATYLCSFKPENRSTCHCIHRRIFKQSNFVKVIKLLIYKEKVICFRKKKNQYEMKVLYILSEKVYLPTSYQLYATI